MSLKKLACILSTLVLVFCAAVSVTQAAGPWFVATTGNDGNDCLTVGTACQTIQGAVNKASSGDTINVAAGTYNEQVTISKTVTLKGAQAGTDARTRSGAESIITYAGGPVQIEADNVVIDGFTIQGASTDPNVDFSALGAGIWTNPGFSGTNGGHQILNNIIQNNIAGIEADNDPSYPATNFPATIQYNLFLNNNLSGAGGGTGIITSFGLNNALIDKNKFSGNINTISIQAQSTSITISNNQFDAGIGLLNTTYSSVTGNKSMNSASSATIDLFGGDDHVTVSGNVLLSGQSAIRVENPYAVYSIVANTNITAQNNCIQGNTAAGLEADHLGYTGIIMADNNWWGSSSGPSGTGPGTGDAIIDPDGVVVFSPFLASPSVCPSAPTITSGNSTIFTVLTPGSFMVTTTGVPTPTLSETGGLPSGVSFTDNGDGTGTLGGTPGTGTTGTYNISFKAANGNSPDATQNFTLAVNKITTTISISNIPGSAVYGGSFTPTYNYIGDGTPSVTSSTPNNCTVLSGVVNFMRAGICTLVAHATTGTNYVATNGSPQSFTIGKAITTISINNIPSGSGAMYGKSFVPTYAYSGDGKTSATSSTLSVCKVTDGKVGFVGVGTCTLTAHANAGTNYAAVNGSPQSFAIAKATTTISVKNIPTNAKKGGNFTPTYNYIGDGTASVTSSTTSVCTVSGSVVNFVNSGTCTLAAQATAGINYAATTGSPQSFTIK
jgi:hypothetical protein